MKNLICLLYVLLLTSVAYADEKAVLVYDAHDKKDPFLPLVTSSGVMVSYDSEISATDISLEGLVIDAKGNNLAIMNGKMIKVGDQVGNYTVDIVANDHVDLVKGQERLTVKFKKGAM